MTGDKEFEEAFVRMDPVVAIKNLFAMNDALGEELAETKAKLEKADAVIRELRKALYKSRCALDRISIPENGCIVALTLTQSREHAAVACNEVNQALFKANEFLKQEGGGE